MTTGSARFAFDFAPNLGLTSPEDGLFVHHAGRDPMDQIRFAADQGFRTVEDNFLRFRPREVQERIGAELARQGMHMGCFVGSLPDNERPTFVLADPDELARQRHELDEAIDLAHRVGGRWLTTLTGRADPGLPRAWQLANVVDNLRRLAEAAERAGVVLLVEPLSTRGTPGKRGWPGSFLTSIAEGYLAVRAVASPAVKLVFDAYHVQAEDGDLLANLDRCGDEVAYVHLADNPGRLEPGTGEINFANLLRRLWARGYRGTLDMEHGLSRDSREGEAAVIALYERLDAEARAGTPAWTAPRPQREPRRSRPSVDASPSSGRPTRRDA